MDQEFRERARVLARAAAQGVGRATAARRSVPDFLIVGAQRCGTTSLFRDLAAHPQVLPPLFNKGIHYFDVHYGQGPTWYRAHFPLDGARRRRARGRGRRITGEASPYYVFHPLAVERIARDLPEVKVVLLLRDPVQRAFSAHRQETHRGFETESFERALELEPQRLAGEVERMRADPSYVSTAHQHHAYVGRGEYDGQVARLFQQLGRERVLVLSSERFFLEPQAEWDRTLEFLELDAWRPAAFGQHNSRTGRPMDEVVRQRLEAHFAPHDAALADLLGRPCEWRR